MTNVGAAPTPHRTLGGITADWSTGLKLAVAGSGVAAATVVGGSAAIVARQLATRLGSSHVGIVSGLAALAAVAGAAGIAAANTSTLKLAGRAARGDVPFHQVRVIASNPARPWLAREVFAAMADTNDAALAHFGRVELDGRADAFQHAYGSALTTVRFVQRHGLDVDDAARLAQRVGTAHEDDRTTNVADRSRQMDLFNNAAGRVIARSLLEVDAPLTDEAIARAVSDAMLAGDLRTIVGGELVPTI